MELNFNRIQEIGMNDYIRELITHNVGEQGNLKNQIFTNTVQNVISSNNKETKLISDALTSILFLDRYKNLTDAISSGYYDYYLLEYYDYYDSVNSLFDMKYLYANDTEELSDALCSARFFSEAHPMFKSTLMNSISKSDDEFLSEITPYHDEDIKKYKRIVTKDELYDYICTERQNLEDAGISKDYDVAFEMNVINYIQRNFFVNPHEVLNLIKEINGDVVSNYSSLSDGFKEYYKNVLKSIELCGDDFAYTAIHQKELLQALFSVFITMKDKNIIKTKKYIKE